MRITMFKPLQRHGFIKDPFRSHYLGFRMLKDHIEHNEPGHEFVFAKWLDDCRTSDPDMVMISSVTEAWMDAVKTVLWLRQTGFNGPIIMGGPHLTGLPESLPFAADCGVVGEGEIPALELVRAYAKTRRPDLSKIPGLVWWGDQGGFNRNPPPPQFDLDDLHIDVERMPEQRFDIATIRGCPFKCIHCVECRLQGKPRWLSAERLADVMQLRYQKTGNPHFFFQDDTFLAAPRRLEELHEILARRDLLNTFQINPVSLNANLVKDHTIQLLKEIGAIRLGMGCESLNPRTLRRMKAGIVTLEHIEKTIELATQANLPIGGSQVHGFPGESEEELIDSFRRVREYEAKSNFRHWEVYICQPFPGSYLWDAAVTMGFVRSDMDFSTMRIDGDKKWFKSPWLFLNQHMMSKKRFVQLLRQHKMQSRGKYLEV